MNEYTNTSLTGSKYYYKDKARTTLHREDGPAIERYDGYKEWYLNGQRHREDGPAIEWSTGDRSWYQNDKPHRMGGPAGESVNGNKMYYVNGEFIFRIDKRGNIISRME